MTLLGRDLSTSELRVNLDEIKLAILRQKSSLAVLETQQRELEMKLSLVVYPVLTLPPEIISRVFVETLPSHGRVRPSAHTPPLTLAQLCSQWRDIALSTPELWSAIDLDFTSIREGNPALYRELPNDGALPLLET
ncbi:hypothetical protein C8R44DRAFT_761344 [Mycena epipterygia]|nr:hypothetical protein C8R44DRAFT_761344 [Mycena epipterygia]